MISASAADETELWHRSYDGGNDDIGNGVAVDTQDNVIVTGYVTQAPGNADCYTVKYDKNGNQLWSVTYDSGLDDQAYDVAVDSANNVIITGYATVASRDFLTIKYGPDGNQLWMKTYDSGRTDWAWGVAVDSQDNVIITGQRRDATSEYYTIKYSKDGDEIWARLHAEGMGEVFDVTVDSRDNVIVTGQVGFPQGKYTTIKYNRDGNRLWIEVYGVHPGDNEGKAVTVDLNDNIIVTGMSGPSVGYDYFFSVSTIKYDNNGNQLWRTNYSAGYNDCAWGVAVDSQNCIIITDSTQKADGTYDYYTIKYSPNGEELCSIRYDGGGNDAPSCVAIDSKDNIIVTGGSANAAGNYDIYTIKYPAPPPNIISFSPDAGVSGSTVIITGTNLLGATSVKFGGIPAAMFKVDSPTQITATVGAGNSGKVTVSNRYGSAVSAADFNFISQVNTASHGSSATGTSSGPQGPVSLPNISIQSASLSAARVAPGTPVTVTVNVTNTGDVNGSSRLTLYVSGREESSQGITVSSGESTPVSFTVSRNKPGSYSVYVNGIQAGNFTVGRFGNHDLILYLSMTLFGLAFIVFLVFVLRKRHAEN
ncbi:MAG: IPT/TIG domain-containing protein [Dehalococcoidia bacterium]|nr:IPT/TIG domain-containing protein [Dehalococcoidia bacterium]